MDGLLDAVRDVLEKAGHRGFAFFEKNIAIGTTTSTTSGYDLAPVGITFFLQTPAATVRITCSGSYLLVTERVDFPSTDVINVASVDGSSTRSNPEGETHLGSNLCLTDDSNVSNEGFPSLFKPVLHLSQNTGPFSKLPAQVSLAPLGLSALGVRDGGQSLWRPSLG